jgi:septum formation protein
LASRSPRRAQILFDIGVRFEVSAPEIDESRHPDEDPPTYVERLAREKALAVAGPERLVVAADTVVVHGGRILGKPGHPEEARTMLRRLQGDRHEVATGLAVAGFDDGPVVESILDVAAVTFLPMTDEEIADYVDSGEPLDKAGAYALQGAGGIYVESVEGSPYTVIGLPIHLLPRMLSRFGHDLGRFRISG